MPDAIPAAVRDDVATLWNYHRLGYEPRPTNVGIGLGSHDIGDIPRMINVMVGDTQRIRLHAERGYAIPQDIPDDVQAAYERLVAAGYTAHLIAEAA